MNAAVPITTVPIAAASATDLSRLTSGELLRRLGVDVDTVAYRAPAPHETHRWQRHSIAGNEYAFAQPITFTPYAAAEPCSARCRFCSENLRDAADAKSSSTRRPDADYFAHLQRALRELEGLPLGYSLSGLETTDDPEWMREMLAALRAHAERSSVTERVLYTNAAGLTNAAQCDRTLADLVAFELDRAEVSRHHFDAAANQRIMRFRDGIAAQDQVAFEVAIRRLAAHIPVRLVCIVQHAGVNDADLVARYLKWAQSLGVTGVILREFSRLTPRYVMNATARYVASQRVAMSDLLEAALSTPQLAAQLDVHRVTEGYYFWNLIARYRGMQVVFEASDYERMHAMHNSGRVYKLVFHTNGNLCAGWNPQRQVLLRPVSAQ